MERQEPTAESDRQSVGADALAAQMLSVNARRVVLIGTIAFTIGFLVLAPFWATLGAHHHRVWLWTCLAGAVLGLAGLPLVDRHQRAGRLG